MAGPLKQLLNHLDCMVDGAVFPDNDSKAEGYKEAVEEIKEKIVNLMITFPENKVTEGCRKCFGSGGKSICPCVFCNGTGKVPKGSQ